MIYILLTGALLVAVLLFVPLDGCALERNSTGGRGPPFRSPERPRGTQALGAWQSPARRVRSQIGAAGPMEEVRQ